MREAMLAGSMLSNSESWINLTQQDLDKLQKPDTILQHKLLSNSENPSKAFMFLELGILPLKYVIMTKRLNFLKYILNENITSMIRKVYEALKQESRKGDFVYLVQKDLMEIDLKLLDEEIHTLSVGKWKGIVRRKIKQAAFQYLIGENLSKEKTKHIVFEKYQMRKYLFINRSTSLAKIIFSVRSGTLDIKEWTPWKYNDNICVICE